MRPTNIDIIGPELAIKWDDGSETFVGLEKMRRFCPCASCNGERDIMGNVYKGPEKPLGPKSFQIVRLNNVGGYAIQPQWADGHNSGLYSYDYIQRLAQADPEGS
jgi:DUF971 family protein